MNLGISGHIKLSCQVTGERKRNFYLETFPLLTLKCNLVGKILHLISFFLYDRIPTSILNQLKIWYKDTQS